MVATIDDNVSSKNEQHSFDLVVKNDCPTAVIAVDTAAGNKKYYIGDAALTFTTVFSLSVPTCPVTLLVTQDTATPDADLITYTWDYATLTASFSVATSTIIGYD